MRKFKNQQEFEKAAREMVVNENFRIISGGAYVKMLEKDGKTVFLMW